MRSLLLALTVSSIACSASGNDDSLGAQDASSSDGSTSDSGTGLGVDALAEVPDTGVMCIAPDMLIALDRTLTMHFKPDGTNPTDAPDYKSSKWSQAITAIKGLATPPIDKTIRFGLELWPKEEPGCITLKQRVEDTAMATNPMCETGEVLVSPALDNGAAINAKLDPATTKICITTPTGTALIEAATHLAGIKEAGRDQYIILVTDGADWDASCPTPNPLEITQQNALKGIKTFVVGFSATMDLATSGVGVPFLNDMACAGKMAPDFAKNCKTDAVGNSTAVDAKNGPLLFLRSEDGAGLATSLGKVAKEICCNCVK